MENWKCVQLVEYFSEKKDSFGKNLINFFLPIKNFKICQYCETNRILLLNEKLSLKTYLEHFSFIFPFLFYNFYALFGNWEQLI